MKKIYSLLFSIISSLSFAQDLQFDPTFNSGNPVSTSYFISGTASDLYYGPMKAINDSLFVYVAQGTEWSDSNEPIEINVFSRLIHSDGSVDEETIYTESVGSTNGNYSAYTVSDILIGEIGQLFIVKNEVNGSGQYNVKLIKYNAYSATNGWTKDNSFGSLGEFIVDLNTDFRDAKGVVINGVPRIYGRYNDTPTGNQLAAAYVVGGGTGSGFSVFTANGANEFSFVGDVIRLASGNVIIADNKYSSVFNGNFYDRTNMNRLIALNISGFAVGTFGTNGIADVSWTTVVSDQPTTYIEKLMQDSSGDILLAGFQSINNSGYLRPKGRLSKFSATGTLVTSFGNSGIYNTDYASNFLSHGFHDIAEMANGNYMVGASSIHQTNGAPDGNRGFVQVINTNGTLNTSYVPDGFLFNTESFMRIDNLHIQNSGKVVILGYVNQGTTSISGIGRLDWANSASISNLENTIMNVYPNPTSTVLNIELSSTSEIRVLASDGKVITLLSGASNYSFDASSMDAGIYFIQTENGATHKFIKQ